VTNLVGKNEREFNGVGGDCVSTALLESAENSRLPAGRGEESEGRHRRVQVL